METNMTEKQSIRICIFKKKKNPVHSKTIARLIKAS